MAKKLYEESNIQAIADAIRGKNGTTNTYKVSEMAGAIGAIEAGGEDPRVKGIIERTITEISDDSITELGNCAFAYCQKLVTVNFPNVTSIGNNAFQECSKLTTLNAENVQTIGKHAFYRCSLFNTLNFPKLTSIGDYAFYITHIGINDTLNFPNVTSIGKYAFYSCYFYTANFPNVTSIGDYAFNRCVDLKTVNIPNVTTLNGTFDTCSSLTDVGDLSQVVTISSNTFYYCIKLPKINLPSVTSIGGSAFKGCSVLTQVIIGTTNCTLSNTSAFTSTPIASGTGYIYVPDEAVETYKAATNWVEYASQIKGISELPQK